MGTMSYYVEVRELGPRRVVAEEDARLLAERGRVLARDGRVGVAATERELLGVGVEPLVP